jgi:DNA ligase-associated metallophosphoesterase
MNSNSRIFNLKHQRLWLLPQKAIYWQKKKTLLVADLHIGKSGHFRKSGVAVPEEVAQSNLNKLDKMVELTEADHLIIVGDLFHSSINNEWNQFINWRKNNRQLEVSLVIGNHDILETANYHRGIINVFSKLSSGPFLFVHDIDQHQDLSKSNQYILSGHIHPAVQLKGRGRQAMKLPCFYFGTEYGVLPAFGGFTGTHIIEPTEKDDIFIIANSKIISQNELKY